jgi:hypothetical protein
VLGRVLLGVRWRRASGGGHAAGHGDRQRWRMSPPLWLCVRVEVGAVTEEMSRRWRGGSGERKGTEMMPAAKHTWRVPGAVSRRPRQPLPGDHTSSPLRTPNSSRRVPGRLPYWPTRHLRALNHCP